MSDSKKFTLRSAGMPFREMGSSPALLVDGEKEESEDANLTKLKNSFSQEQDSTVTYNSRGLVDSTPEGKDTVSAGGFGWGALTKSNVSETQSVWQDLRDKVKTKEVMLDNRSKSEQSDTGIGGVRPTLTFD